jgi:outer membrane protein assembly factor BamA
MKALLASWLFIALLQSPHGFPPVATIDFYGLRTVSEAQLRQVLGLREGDSVDMKHYEEWKNEEIQKLEAVPGVRSANLTLVCCTNDRKSLLYVGIEEAATPCIAFQRSPGVNVRLTEDVVQASKTATEAVQRAVIAGNAQEDDSQGHSLVADPEARALQLALIPLA